MAVLWDSRWASIRNCGHDFTISMVTRPADRVHLILGLTHHKTGKHGHGAQCIAFKESGAQCPCIARGPIFHIPAAWFVTCASHTWDVVGRRNFTDGMHLVESSKDKRSCTAVVLQPICKQFRHSLLYGTVKEWHCPSNVFDRVSFAHSMFPFTDASAMRCTWHV